MSGFAADLEELRQRLATAGIDTGPVDRSVLLQDLETAYEELRAADEEVRAQQEQIAGLVHGYDALRLQHERMLSMLPVPVLITDQNGVVRVANAAAAEFLQMRPGRMVGKPALLFVAPESRGALRTALSPRGLAQGPMRRVVTIVPRGREEVTVEVTLTPAPGRQDAVSWMLLSAGTMERRPALAAIPTTLTTLSALPATCPDVHAALESAARLVADALGEDVHVSITIGSPLEPEILGSSSELAQHLDGTQLAAGQGPSVTAYDTSTLVEAEDVASDERWPRLDGRALADLGAVAVPLSYAGPPAGVLTVYCPPSTLDADFVEPCQLFASTVSAVVYELAAKEELASMAAGLERAMASRAVIEQAKGVIMAAKGCDADEAFGHLVDLSSTQHVKLREIARRVVQSPERR